LAKPVENVSWISTGSGDPRSMSGVLQSTLAAEHSAFLETLGQTLGVRDDEDLDVAIGGLELDRRRQGLASPDDPPPAERADGCQWDLQRVELGSRASPTSWTRGSARPGTS